jgi:hypothetical protein
MIGPKTIANQKNKYSPIDIIRKFLEYGNLQSQTYEDALQEITTTLKGEGFFPVIVIRKLWEAHHVQEEDSVRIIHPHEDNTLIIATLVEDEETKQCEEFPQRLKERVKKDKCFCKQLVDLCGDIHFLIELCAKR